MEHAEPINTRRTKYPPRTRGGLSVAGLDLTTNPTENASVDALCVRKSQSPKRTVVAARPNALRELLIVFRVFPPREHFQLVGWGDGAKVYFPRIITQNHSRAAEAGFVAHNSDALSLLLVRLFPCPCKEKENCVARLRVVFLRDNGSAVFIRNALCISVFWPSQ